MTTEERDLLEKEYLEISLRLKTEFPSPKDLRRKEEISSLLLTDGKNCHIKFKFREVKNNRVTSFTKNRR